MGAAPNQVSERDLKKLLEVSYSHFVESISTFLAEANTKSVHSEVSALNSRMQSVSSHPHSAEPTGHVLHSAEPAEPVPLKNGAFLVQ